MKKIPLTYKGEQVGEAEVEFTDQGAVVKGTLYDTEKAVAILGPSIEHVSFGFDDNGIDFSGIQPNDHMVKHFRDNTPVRYGKENDVERDSNSGLL